MLFSRKVVLVIILCLLFACTNRNNHQVDQEETTPPANILLIVADDLGYSDLGCYGSEIKTPNLDLLAKNGIRNTSFYTAPTCSPTRGMLLSGVDNHRCGYGTMEGDWASNQKGVRGYEGHLNYDVVTFPKLLEDNGYHTSIAGKWHQAFPATEETLWPDKRGFSRSFCLLQGGAGHFEDMQRMFSFYKKTLYVEDGQYVDELPEGFYSSDYYTDKTIEYINESKDQNKPFFSMLSFTAPHWPLQVPDEFIDDYKNSYDEGYEAIAAERLLGMKELDIIPTHTQLPPLSPNVMPWDELSVEEQKREARIMEVYAAMITRLDYNVGRVIAHLKAIGSYENTLIVFMADNGAEGNNIGNIVDTEAWVAENYDNSFENIGRKNSYVYTGPGWAQVSSLPYKWYKGFTSEGGVRAPMIVAYPFQEDKHGSINHNILSVMDIAPTFLEYAGIEHPGNKYSDRDIYTMDGISMLSWLKGEATYSRNPEKAFCWELYGRLSARKGDWKLEWLDSPYGGNNWALYNLSEDPGCITDLYTLEHEVFEDLYAEWIDYHDAYELVLPDEKVGYGADKIWREDVNY